MTINANVNALTASLAELTTAVAALQTSVNNLGTPTIDFTPVLTPLAAVATQVTQVINDLEN